MLIWLCLNIIEEETKSEFNNPERELFVWAILLNRKDLALIFWKACADQIGRKNNTAWIPN